MGQQCCDVAGPVGRQSREEVLQIGVRVVPSEATVPNHIGSACVDATSHPRLPKSVRPVAAASAKHAGFIEQSIAWPHAFRRLKILYGQYARAHEAFLSFAPLDLLELAQPNSRSITLRLLNEATLAISQ